MMIYNVCNDDFLRTPNTQWNQDREKHIKPFLMLYQVFESQSDLSE